MESDQTRQTQMGQGIARIPRAGERSWSVICCDGQVALLVAPKSRSEMFPPCTTPEVSGNSSGPSEQLHYPPAARHTPPQNAQNRDADRVTPRAR